MDASISSSVSASRRFQSVLPFRRGASRETIVIFFSFISPRTPRSYDPAHIVPKRADDHHLSAVEKPAHDVARFSTSIGSQCDDRTIEDDAQFLKIDASFAQNANAFCIVPSERTNPCEQLIEVFRHSDPPPMGGCDTIGIAESSL